MHSCSICTQANRSNTFYRVQHRACVCVCEGRVCVSSWVGSGLFRFLVLTGLFTMCNWTYSFDVTNNTLCAKCSRLIYACVFIASHCGTRMKYNSLWSHWRRVDVGLWLLSAQNIRTGQWQRIQKKTPFSDNRNVIVPAVLRTLTWSEIVFWWWCCLTITQRTYGFVYYHVAFA